MQGAPGWETELHDPILAVPFQLCTLKSQGYMQIYMGALTPLFNNYDVSSVDCPIGNWHAYPVKKAFRYSRLQPGCHLPNSPWAVIIEFSK